MSSPTDTDDETLGTQVLARPATTSANVGRSSATAAPDKASTESTNAAPPSESSDVLTATFAPDEPKKHVVAQSGDDSLRQEYHLNQSPADALLAAEARRVRWFAVFIVFLAPCVGISAWVVGGDTLAQRLHFTGLSSAMIGSLWMAIGMLRQARYTPHHLIVFAFLTFPAAWSGFYFWGPTSLVLAIVPFGLFIYASGRSAFGALLTSVTNIAVHLTLSILLLSETISNPAVLQAMDTGINGQIVMLLIVQLIFVAAYVLGRTSYRSSLRAVTELHRALSAVNVRDALLVEAKQNLAQAMRIGGPGRYTDQRIGSFDMGAVIGRGAMGEVYEATHHETGVLAAVKLLHPHILAHPNHIRRFLREVRIIASLQHPNVVQVLEVPDRSDGLPYLAMERLRGHSLRELLNERSTLPLDEILDLLDQVSNGLSAAHSQGIVHRDLKPQNLFHADVRDSTARWKVLDFGVCKLRDTEGTLTQDHIVGTPSYMAPEQTTTERDIDTRADIHALGVICYRALTGRPAFMGANVMQVLRQVLRRMPTRPSSLRRDIPKDVDRVLHIAMAKRPDDRFASAVAFVEAFSCAIDDNLPTKLRTRADTLMSRHPWGARRTRALRAS